MVIEELKKVELQPQVVFNERQRQKVELQPLENIVYAPLKSVPSKLVPQLYSDCPVRISPKSVGDFQQCRLGGNLHIW